MLQAGVAPELKNFFAGIGVDLYYIEQDLAPTLRAMKVSSVSEIVETLFEGDHTMTYRDALKHCDDRLSEPLERLEGLLNYKAKKFVNAIQTLRGTRGQLDRATQHMSLNGWNVD